MSDLGISSRRDRIKFYLWNDMIRAVPVFEIMRYNSAQLGGVIRQIEYILLMNNLHQEVKQAFLDHIQSSGGYSNDQMFRRMALVTESQINKTIEAMTGSSFPLRFSWCLDELLQEVTCFTGTRVKTLEEILVASYDPKVHIVHTRTKLFQGPYWLLRAKGHWLTVRIEPDQYRDGKITYTLNADPYHRETSEDAEIARFRSTVCIYNGTDANSVIQIHKQQKS